MDQWKVFSRDTGSVRLQYFSDIHLEFGGLEIEKTNADVIIAAGDIGVGLQGLEWLKSFGRPVIYVAGNHEFYGQEYFSTIDALRNQCAGSKVRFLERECMIMGEVRFLGCTLWTELGGEENERLEELKRVVNDFRQIRYRNEHLAFSHYTMLHRESRRWLVNELEQPFDGKTVVITHHAPTPWSWHESPSNIKRFAYCNDLKELFHNHEIAAWFHGHIHVVSDYRCSGARVLCNPRGYHPSLLVPDFDSGRTIDI
jgi:Icc-related predicted phosphoesterase